MMLEKPILVAFATRTDTTKEVAAAITRVLHEKGDRVEMHEVSKVKDLSPYRAVILGSGIRAGKWLPEAIHFVQHHKTELKTKPLLYFLVCGTLSEPTPEHIKEVTAYLDPVRALVEPLALGLFAGAINFAKLPWLPRLMLKALKSPEGDWRDWEAIESWAAAMHELIREEEVTSV